MQKIRIRHINRDVIDKRDWSVTGKMYWKDMGGYVELSFAAPHSTLHDYNYDSLVTFF